MDHKTLYDSNQNYLKTACLITQIKTHSQAEANCEENGMELFDVKSVELQNALFALLSNTQGLEGTFHVKGQIFGECQQIFFSNGSFKVKLGSCNDTFYSYCGYDNPDL